MTWDVALDAQLATVYATFESAVQIRPETRAHGRARVSISVGDGGDRWIVDALELERAARAVAIVAGVDDNERP